MESVSLRLLKQLAKHRELTVRDCAALLPKRTNDHLDFYPLASLIKQGLVDIYDVTTDGSPFHEGNEMDMAIDLYVWALGNVGEFEYRGEQLRCADFRDEKIFATAKGYFVLDEMRSKRTERLWAFSAGIVIAIVAASLKGRVG